MHFDCVGWLPWVWGGPLSAWTAHDLNQIAQRSTAPSGGNRNAQLQQFCRAQVSVHMNAVLRTDARSLSIPIDHSDKLALWRLYVTFLAVCVPYTSPQRPPGVMSGEELRKHLVAILRGEVEQHMLVARTALGACHVAHLPHVFQARCCWALMRLVPIWCRRMFDTATQLLGCKSKEQTVPRNEGVRALLFMLAPVW
jgi:hypothetical protein